MYLSRIDLRYRDLPIAMQAKLNDNGVYAIHQWLWQLFPERQQRDFLFRQESMQEGIRCYILSAASPDKHNLLQVVTKEFNPQILSGHQLGFSLRVNPVITRNGKRSDVLMDAKFHAANDLASDDVWQVQQQAAMDWLTRQGNTKGFELNPENILVTGYQQHRLSKPKGNSSIRFSSVDMQGVLSVTEPDAFLLAIANGFGKSKALGCGLMLLKRA